MKKPIKFPFLPELRLNSPFWQNVIMGILVGLTAGLYVALNLLGAGGGKPSSAHMVQVVNSLLCAVWFFSASFGGSILNTIGPAITACFGVIGYIIYVGSLWYFDQTGKEGFPIFAGFCIGISSGLIFVTMGYIAMSYSEEEDRGSYITLSVNLQAMGSVVGGIIPLIINRDSSESAGVPTAVYVVFIIMMAVGACMAFLLQPPSKIFRDDGTQVSVVQPRGFVEELKANLEIFRDWKLLIMVPAFLPAECFLVYAGSVNAFHNNLRTRSLLSFVAVCLQIPCGYLLQKILDHKVWARRTRALIGIVFVGVPLIGAWLWETVRVRNYNRALSPAVPLDWSNSDFIPIFFLFMLSWVASSLYQYLTLYILGCFSNSPRKAANYAGVFRGVLGAGEAICFGVDSTSVAFIKEAGVILAFYTIGIFVYLYLAAFHIQETKYFTSEEDVIIPKHVLAEHEHGEATQVVEGASGSSIDEEKKRVGSEKDATKTVV